MIPPLTPAQLTLGCYLTAVLLNLVVAGYAFTIVKRLAGDGVFAKVARFAAAAAAAFAVCNGIGAFGGSESLVIAAVELVGAAMLMAATYSLYTLVKV
jgi:hypothetical protein